MKKEYLSGKDNIIIAAIDIMNELGICGLTIREIAKKQGITDGAIYKHFESKQEIIVAILDYYSRFDLRIFNTLKEKKLECRESILFLVSSLVEYYESYPAITSIMFAFDCLKFDDALYNQANQIYDGRYNFLIGLIEEGQKRKEIREEIISEELGNIIMGILMSIVLKWRMNNFQFSLKSKVISTLETLLKLC